MEPPPSDDDSLIVDAAFVRELERMEVDIRPRVRAKPTPNPTEVWPALPSPVPGRQATRRDTTSAHASDARRVRRVFLLMLIAGAVAAVLVFHERVSEILARLVG